MPINTVSEHLFLCALSTGKASSLRLRTEKASTKYNVVSVSTSANMKVAQKFGQEKTANISLGLPLNVLGKSLNIQPVLHRCNGILLLCILLLFHRDSKFI